MTEQNNTNEIGENKVNTQVDGSIAELLTHIINRLAFKYVVDCREGDEPIKTLGDITFADFCKLKTDPDCIKLISGYGYGDRDSTPAESVTLAEFIDILTKTTYEQQLKDHGKGVNK